MGFLCCVVLLFSYTSPLKIIILIDKYIVIYLIVFVSGLSDRCGSRLAIPFGMWYGGGRLLWIISWNRIQYSGMRKAF